MSSTTWCSLAMFTAPLRRCFSQQSVRVRFAPSPTGHLHLGGLRTALFNYLFARSHGGRFILRIEDTDAKRAVPGAAEALQRDLQWAGIEVDEGPFVQSSRLEIYQSYSDELLASGAAYRCFCSDRRLGLLRRDALRSRQVPRYDNKCRRLEAEEVGRRLERGEEYCVRLKLRPGVQPHFDDLVFGRLAYDPALHEGDPVLLKTDGRPTYHLASCVDDRLMGVTHVLRGCEWLLSTAKQLLVWAALGWGGAPPRYAHLPLLLQEDGSKLSKRRGDGQVCRLRAGGALPGALVNYVARCGGGGFRWAEAEAEADRLFSMQELIDRFDLSTVTAHSSRLRPAHLTALNHMELMQRLQSCGEASRLDLANQLLDLLREKKQQHGADIDADVGHLLRVLDWAVGASRADRLQDLVEDPDLEFLWSAPPPLQGGEAGLSPEEGALLGRIADRLERPEAAAAFSRDVVKEMLRDAAKAEGRSAGAVMQLVRRGLSGRRQGPAVAEMVEILGRERTVDRLKRQAIKCSGD